MATKNIVTITLSINKKEVQETTLTTELNEYTIQSELLMAVSDYINFGGKLGELKDSNRVKIRDELILDLYSKIEKLEKQR